MLHVSGDRFGGISLSTDAQGRVYRWYRDGEALAATHAPILRDLRPDKCLRFVPATDPTVTVEGEWETTATRRIALEPGSRLTLPFTGVAVAVVADCHGQGGPLYTAMEARLDGAAPEVFHPEGWGDHPEMMIWGRGDLDDSPHVLTLTQQTGVPCAFCGFWVCERDCELGQPMTYMVEIDGAAREQVTVTPVVDRQAIFDVWADEVIAWYAEHHHSEWSAQHELWPGIAVLYALTGREELRRPALQQVQYQISLGDESVDYLPPAPGHNFPFLTHNGRMMSHLYCLYRQFGEEIFLHMADTMVTAYLERWPKVECTVDGRMYANVLTHGARRAADGYYQVVELPDACGNSFSHTAQGLVMAWEEPDSRHFRSDAVRALAVENARYALALLQPDGGIWYYPGMQKPDWNYALYMMEHIAHVATSTGELTEEADRMARYLTRFGTREPLIMEMFVYPHAVVPVNLALLTATHAFLGQPPPRAFVDMMYSAAMGGENGEYHPAGREKIVPSTLPPQDALIHILCTQLRGHSALLNLRVPMKVWR